MKRLLRFEHRTSQQNAFNEEVGAWEEVATAYGDFEELKGAEFFAALQSQSKITGRVTCRYMPALAALTPKDRIVCDDLTYDIQAVIDPKLRHRELHFFVADHSAI